MDNNSNHNNNKNNEKDNKNSIERRDIEELSNVFDFYEDNFNEEEKLLEDNNSNNSDLILNKDSLNQNINPSENSNNINNIEGNNINHENEVHAKNDLQDLMNIDYDTSNDEEIISMEERTSTFFEDRIVIKNESDESQNQPKNQSINQSINQSKNESLSNEEVTLKDVKTLDSTDKNSNELDKEIKENLKEERKLEDEMNELNGLDDFEKEVANKYAYTIAREDVTVSNEMEENEDKFLEEEYKYDEMYQNQIKPFVESENYDKAKEQLYLSMMHGHSDNEEEKEERDIEERTFYGSLFLSGKPVEMKIFNKMFNNFNLENRLIGYVEKFNHLNLGFRIVKVSGGYQLVTDADVSTFLESYFGEKVETLSKASLECLSIIAYKQPVTKAELEDLRGVISSGPMKLLLDKNLIRVVGRKDVPGKPLLYATTSYFLEYFGINSLSDLPTFREWMELKNNQ